MVGISFGSVQTILKDQILSGDESWIYAYDPETTDQSIEYRLKGDLAKVVRKSR